MSTLGEGIKRPDGPAKARGATRYLPDVQVPGMLHACMVLARRPHAVIKSISLSRAISSGGVECVAAGADVPGENQIGLLAADQPLFACDRVRYEGDCVAIVGASDADTARRSASLVAVDYEDLAPAPDLESVLGPDAPEIHEGGNIAVDRLLIKGDISEGERTSDVVIEKVFDSPVQEHAYLETQGALAVPGSDGSMEIFITGQCPFYVREAVARCLGLELARVRVIQLPLGGGFGGKEDVPSEIGARAAVLAVKSGRPVRLVLSREEDLIYSSKRHPMRMSYRMGCSRDGRIMFTDAEIAAGVGAYTTLSPIVLYRATVHAAGPYEIPNVRVRTRGYYTNSPPSGAMRGFGQPQVCFACEAMMDEAAKALGLDPVEFRMKNALKVGSVTATGQVLEESVGLEETLKSAADFIAAGGSGGRRGRPEAAEDGDGRLRGIGVASMHYGVSLGAIGRAIDRGGAKVEILRDGSVSVFIGCTEMGQGALTVVGQIAAESLGVSPERVTVHPVDTHIVPDSGPTVASRTTIVSGNAVVDACGKILERMVGAASAMLGGGSEFVPSEGVFRREASGDSVTFDQVLAECLSRRVDLADTGWYAVPECFVDPDTGQGKAYHVYSFATQVAEVTVDTGTGSVDVVGFHAAHDSGRIVNRTLAAAQVEGGVAQGLGFALTENYSHSGGYITSSEFSTYLLPTSLDVCDRIGVDFIECISSDGPFGVKGLGEPATIPAAAAIANAVSSALGKRVKRLPIRRGWVTGADD
ncbi:MAG: xanthine dehydrogenase family protein molybdopterin-binding subunit [bacterium]